MKEQLNKLVSLAKVDKVKLEVDFHSIPRNSSEQDILANTKLQ